MLVVFQSSEVLGKPYNLWVPVDFWQETGTGDGLYQITLPVFVMDSKVPPTGITDFLLSFVHC